jgi:hypothetical protein
MLRCTVPALYPAITGIIKSAECRLIPMKNKTILYRHTYRLEEDNEVYELNWQDSPVLKFVPGTQISFDYSIETKGEWTHRVIALRSLRSHNSESHGIQSQYSDSYDDGSIVTTQNKSSCIYTTQGMILSTKTTFDDTSPTSSSSSSSSQTNHSYMHSYTLGGDDENSANQYDLLNQLVEQPQYRIGTHVEILCNKHKLRGHTFFDIVEIKPM